MPDTQYSTREKARRQQCDDMRWVCYKHHVDRVGRGCEGNALCALLCCASCFGLDSARNARNVVSPLDRLVGDLSPLPCAFCVGSDLVVFQEGRGALQPERRKLALLRQWLQMYRFVRVGDRVGYERCLGMMPESAIQLGISIRGQGIRTGSILIAIRFHLMSSSRECERSSALTKEPLGSGVDRAPKRLSRSYMNTSWKKLETAGGTLRLYVIFWDFTLSSTSGISLPLNG